MYSPAFHPPGPWPAGTLLARLGEPARKELLNMAPLREYDSGEALINQGDGTNHIFVLRSLRPSASACVKVTARLDNGAECLLGIRVSGDAVGELALIRNTRRSATVTTCSPIRAHTIRRDDFIAFLGRHEEAWPALTGMIADRLDWANERRLEFVGYPVPVRLARVLVALEDRHGFPVPNGHDVGVLLSQEEMGRLIGAGRDAIGKAVRLLKAENLIDASYRTTVIRDRAALCSYAELPYRAR